MYKKNSSFQSDKLSVRSTVVQVLPPTLGFGDSALFEFLQRLQSPLSVTALPLRVKSCLTWASGLDMCC